MGGRLPQILLNVRFHKQSNIYFSWFLWNAFCTTILGYHIAAIILVPGHHSQSIRIFTIHLLNEKLFHYLYIAVLVKRFSVYINNNIIPHSMFWLLNFLYYPADAKRPRWGKSAFISIDILLFVFTNTSTFSYLFVIIHYLIK